MSTPIITHSEWMEAYREAMEKKVDKIPEGWKTTAEIARELDVQRSAAGEVIRLLLRSGKAKMRSFKVMTETGKIRNVPHYRIK